MRTNNPLPPSGEIDVAKLARAFDDTTQCYKFLFFRALLDRFNKTGGKQIGLVDILADMIEAAWWPVMHYRLTIGVGQTAHQMGELVKSMAQDAGERFGQSDVRAYSTQTANARIAAEISRGVLRYVPTRFLTPWIGANAGSRDDRAIIVMTAAESAAYRQPYLFIDRRTIEIADSWADYFRENMPILTAWADLAWLSWLQARNPNVVVNIDKLYPPADRQSLALQTAFLRTALDADSRCIFTNQVLSLDGIALDHFLPRSYVGHDRIWNLAPIDPITNSKKGARLPYPEAIDRLASLHSRAIDLAGRGHVKTWPRYREEYASDLRIDPTELGQPERLADAYRGTIGPMLTIAARMGFPAGWP